MTLKRLQLKKREERRLLSGHLWVFSNEIDAQATPLVQFEPGEQVRIESATGKFLGIGFANPGSLICARLVSRTPQCLDKDLLSTRIKEALSLRQRLFKVPYYRLCHGESDLLPGLIIDRFDAHLSVQINCAGMERLKKEIINALVSILSPQSILLKNDSTARALEGLELNIVSGYGTPPEHVLIVENGVTMKAPLATGQKTGWFYDQRENRRRLNTYVRGQNVLDLFSYVGSFGIQAAVHGATHVTSVDGSQAALDMASENGTLNQVQHCFTPMQGDCFEITREMRHERRSFGVVIVDPPAFIKRKKDHKEGFQAYRRINELAMRLLEPGGIMLSASCSMHLHRDELREVLRHCGQRLGRHIRILEEGLQGPDHPIHPAIPQTSYLKAFIIQVQ